MKATYHRNGLVYRESSSEDEAGGGGLLSSEVIEIDDDDDDDVIAVGCCKSHYFLMGSYHLLILRPENGQVIKNVCFSSVLRDVSVVPPKKSVGLGKDPVVRRKALLF